MAQFRRITQMALQFGAAATRYLEAYPEVHEWAQERQAASTSDSQRRTRGSTLLEEVEEAHTEVLGGLGEVFNRLQLGPPVQAEPEGEAIVQPPAAVPQQEEHQPEQQQPLAEQEVCISFVNSFLIISSACSGTRADCRLTCHGTTLPIPLNQIHTQNLV
jgi:hypothetical protein